ncbi:MAG: hypothetical protein ACFE0S_02685 [Rhodospirillales bacterium]
MSKLSRKLFPAIVGICVLATLTACTKEKAQALLNAANLFRAESTKAIEAFEELFVASSTKLAVTDEQRIEAAIENTAIRYGTDNFVDSAAVLGWLNTGERRIRNSVAANFADVQIGYDRFAAMFVNLPDGSYLVDRGLIECAAEKGARLADDMVKMGLYLKNNPVPFLQKESQLQTRLNDALKNKNDAEVAVIITQFDALAREQRKLNEKAVAQAAVAATAGMAAVEAAQKFNTYDVATLLAVTGKALEVITQSNVFNLEQASKQLTAVQTKLKDDDHWKRVLAMEFGAKETPCNMPAK